MATKRAKPQSHVLMVGTSTQTMGGIATVVQGYIDAGLFDTAPVLYISTHADGSTLRKLACALAGYGRFLAALLRYRIVLLHVHLSSRASFWRKLPIFVIARILRYPYIVHLHGSEFMIFYESESGLFAQSLIRSVFDHADTVLALSPEWRQNVSGFSRNPDIRVFPNGVPVADNLPARPPGGGRLKLLFLGRLGRRKGIYDLLRALAQFHPEFTNFELIAAGDGEIAEVAAEARKLGLAEHVATPGWVDVATKADLLRQADIFLLPSHAEGLPMSLLEAMAAGLPVICSTAGGIPLAVSHDVEGLLVEPGNVDELRDALALMMQDSDTRSACGRRAYERARRDFSVDSCVAQLKEIYASYGATGPG